MGDEINDWDDDWSEWRYNSFRVAMRGFYLDYDSEYNVIDYEGSEEDGEEVYNPYDSNTPYGIGIGLADTINDYVQEYFS